MRKKDGRVYKRTAISVIYIYIIHIQKRIPKSTDHGTDFKWSISGGWGVGFLLHSKTSLNLPAMGLALKNPFRGGGCLGSLNIMSDRLGPK